MKKLFALFAISIGLIFSVSSCMDDVFSSSASDNITISTDSVKYDTVFTTIKQPTRILKLYNRNDKALRISSIYVAGGESSPFRLIVNGQRKQSFSDIDVFAKDSIYLFVDMELNANNSNLPVFISDSIYIVCNNVVKKVILNGFGQDVVILRDTIFSSSTTLTADKPYLVFGDMEVSENATLTISPGTVLYFHNNSGIKIKGTLSAIGSADKFIIMRGDRTDNIFTNTPYDSISNQWNGLEFISKGNNVLEYVEMRSGRNAIDLWTDSLSQNITVSNCIIRNFGGYGIASKNSKVTIANSIIANSGINSIYMSGGSIYTTHCSFASYSRNRSGVSIRLLNHDKSIISPLSASFNNCIVAGSNANELTLDDFNKANDITADFNVSFSSCLLSASSADLPYFNNCLFSKSSDVVFANTARYPYDFSLSPSSMAIDAANASIASSYPLDFRGANRLADGLPDIGAIEFVK